MRAVKDSLAAPFKRDLAGCGKTVVARENFDGPHMCLRGAQSSGITRKFRRELSETGRMGEMDGGSRSEVRGFQNVEPRTSNFTSRLSRMSRVSRATVGAAEVGDDESRVCDWVCREGGCVLIGHRGAQSLGRLADGKRERRVLLNLPEMGHRIPVPSWKREPRQPRVGGEGHGASGTDSRLPVVAALLRGLGCREFLFNQRCWCHQARFSRWMDFCTVSRWPL